MMARTHMLAVTALTAAVIGALTTATGTTDLRPAPQVAAEDASYGVDGYLLYDPSTEPVVAYSDRNDDSVRWKIVDGTPTLVHSSIRTVMASRAASVTLTGPHRLKKGARLPMKGTVPVRAKSSVRRTVQIQQFHGDQWKMLATVKAQPSGAFEVLLRTPNYPDRTILRAKVLKSDGKPTAISREHKVAVGSDAELEATKHHDTAADWAWLIEDTTWETCALTWAYIPKTGSTTGYAGARGHMKEALAQIAAVSEFTFTEVAAPAKPSEEDGIDITLRFLTPEQEPRLKGGAVGYAHTTAEWGHLANVDIVIDRSANMYKGFHPYGGSFGDVMLHEISHGLGLDHAEGHEQIMYSSSETGTLGKGDKGGLTAVSEHCATPENG